MISPVLLLHLNLSGNGIVQVTFQDARALPRLLLPRLIQKMAEMLHCDPLSVVVVPFEDSAFFAANAEDRGSMMLLGQVQTWPFCQGDSPHVKYKVSWDPFKVRSLTTPACCSSALDRSLLVAPKIFAASRSGNGKMSLPRTEALRFGS